MEGVENLGTKVIYEYLVGSVQIINPVGVPRITKGERSPAAAGLRLAGCGALWCPGLGPRSRAESCTGLSGCTGRECTRNTSRYLTKVIIRYLHVLSTLD